MMNRIFSNVLHLVHRHGAKIAIVSAFLTIPLFSNAQVVDLSQAKGPETAESALFVLTAEGSNKYEKTGRLTHVDEAEFFAHLEKFYNAGNFLLVRLNAPIEPGADGEITLQTTVAYPGEQLYKSAVRTEGEKLSKCISHGKGRQQITICLYNYGDARKYIPASAGRVRKILPTNDYLVMTTDIGQIITARVEGSYTQPTFKMYLVKVPMASRQELLSQDLVRIFWGAGYYNVITGVNGTLDGEAFGSKLNSFEGHQATSFATRKFIEPLLLNWSNPTFSEVHFGRTILVELSPLTGKWSKIPYLGKEAKNLHLNMTTLSDVKEGY
jgi:hypothetical protein